MRVDVGDAELEVEVSGPDDAPTVLCWNGAGLTLRQWDTVRDRLEGQFRFVCFDVRGVGKSSVGRHGDADQFTFERYAQDADRMLSSLEIETVITWAMAWGSRAALVHAAMYSHSVDRAALFDLSIEAADPEAQKMQRRLALQRQDAIGIGRFERPAGIAEHENLEHLRAARSASLKTDLAKHIPQLSMPVLRATGDHDPNLASSRRVAEMTRWARLEVMVNVGHGSVLQRPDLACKLFLSFTESAAA